MNVKYLVITQHRSEYPEPITLGKGDLVEIGEEYEGEEGWENWHFCTLAGQAGGWVPGQIIERTDGNTGRVLEDYCAKELDVDVGETLTGLRELNGWVWCCKPAGTQTGWVPASNLTRSTSG